MESYRVILDTAGSISDHGRSAPGQGVEMEISPETMNVMQKNAEYGREVLDAALKIVRGESPAVDPGSIPPPMSVPTTTTRLVGHGVSNSVSASTTTISSSSLAGAVTSPQEAAASSAPTSSLPKTIVAVKVDKDVGGIRVIEDGPLKKMESKEGGTKSSDRKRQVRRRYFMYTLYLDAYSNSFFSQKTTDDGQHDGQTCLGCRATSTPEWRRGPLGAYEVLFFLRIFSYIYTYRPSNVMQCLRTCLRKNGLFHPILCFHVTCANSNLCYTFSLYRSKNGAITNPKVQKRRLLEKIMEEVRHRFWAVLWVAKCMLLDKKNPPMKIVEPNHTLPLKNGAAKWQIESPCFSSFLS